MDDPKEVIRGWLIEGRQKDRTTPERVAVVECIMSQNGWRFLQEGLCRLRAEGVIDGESRLELMDLWVALYANHAGPHLASCPHGQPGGDRPATGHLGAIERASDDV